MTEQGEDCEYVLDRDRFLRGQMLIEAGHPQGASPLEGAVPPLSISGLINRRRAERQKAQYGKLR